MAAKCPTRQKLVKARIQMLMNMPFFGVLATHLQLKEIDAKFCPTAGTDGRSFYYNKDFIESLDDEECKFLFAHEVMHCCYDHMGRRGRRDADLYNQAADHVINLEITDQNVGKLISRPNDDPAMIPCHDTKYRGMSSDEVYEILYDEQEKNGGQGQGHSFDVHFDADSMTDEEAEEAGIDKMTDDEKSMVRDAFRQATLEAAKSAGAENVPNGVRSMIDDLLDPQMDWRECLNANIQTLVKNDWTYSRPNRRNSSLGGIILPGNDFDEAVSVCCAIDTSGSISHQMIREFLSEIKGIMEQFKQFEIKIWCFDTDTYTIWNYNEDNADDMDEFFPEGGGGTEFMVNWDRMKEEDIEPDQFVMFTDGYPYGSWGEEEYQDNMVFLISGNPRHDIVAPFGTTLYYDD